MPERSIGRLDDDETMRKALIQLCRQERHKHAPEYNERHPGMFSLKQEATAGPKAPVGLKN